MDVIAYLSDDKNIKLNEQQQQGVLSFEKNTLLLAVPGSGKTTVLVSRIANLMLNHHVSRNQILTLTYNRETAKDMKARFISLFGAHILDIPHFATIHSFCLSVMNHYSREYNRPMPNIIELRQYANTKSRVLRDIYKHYNDEFISEDNYDTLERLICYSKNMMLTNEDMQKGKFEIDNFHKIFQDYESYKRKNHFIDFDDMLTLTYEILNKFPAILTYFQSQYRYINIDEAQDTSLVQHRIIELLSKKCKIFMVGDEDQSIYSFRG
ncbi:MAG: UvrD-helicase domain-containing protein, partial [Oscillospiraceae bacterium]